MCSDRRYRGFASVGFPIRTSPGLSLYTALRSFSQCPTSFIGTWRLGIHRKPLVAYLRDAENSKLFLRVPSFSIFFFCALLSRCLPTTYLLLAILLVTCCPDCSGLAGSPPGCASYLQFGSGAQPDAEPIATKRPGKSPGLSRNDSPLQLYSKITALFDKTSYSLAFQNMNCFWHLNN